MDRNSRRNFVASVVAVGLVPTVADAQKSGSTPQPGFFNAYNSGKYHSEAISALQKWLDGTAPNSAKGMNILIDALAATKLLSADDAKQLASLVDAIFATSNREALNKAIAEVSGQVSKEATSLARSFMEIVRASASQAWTDVSSPRGRQIVAEDFAGALTAAAGATAALADPPVFVGIALAGSIAASIRAYYAK